MFIIIDFIQSCNSFLVFSVIIKLYKRMYFKVKYPVESNVYKQEKQKKKLFN